MNEVRPWDEFSGSPLAWDDAQALHNVDPEDLESAFLATPPDSGSSEDESEDEGSLDLPHNVQDPAAEGLTVGQTEEILRETHAGVTEQEVLQKFLRSVPDSQLDVFLELQANVNLEGDNIPGISVAANTISITADNQAGPELDPTPGGVEDNHDHNPVGPDNTCNSCEGTDNKIKRCLVCGNGHCFTCNCREGYWTTPQLEENAWVCAGYDGITPRDLCDDMAAMYCLKTD